MQKNSKSTTIQISIETYEKIYRIKTQIEKFIQKPISYDKLIQILFCLKDFESILSDLILE